ncbi:MAG: methenyltetrahydrofolate cyclohydrolase [Candidatus Peregrinibacteria bacterium Gr01-1014_25]|nr:MAG: methenyltetrahydrofolate cyclohydrolase [Candidatus Peregrinibacteria bacterium Gr01-1014_25]
MSPTILSGNEPAAAILEEIKPRVAELDPQLVAVQVGDDPASTAYVRRKLKACTDVGMRHRHVHLAAETTFEKLLGLIQELNADPDVSGYIVQLPLPGSLKAREAELFSKIDPHKDIDGFTARNIGKTVLSPDFEHLPPATPAGVIAMLRFYRIDVKGKIIVVIGQGNIVGKPLSNMLQNRGATVTCCNVHTPPERLKAFCREADVIISAVGKGKLITADMIGPDKPVVIDIGITRDEQTGKIVGDVDYANVAPLTSAITPVPGGVGPMTVAMLLQNCCTAKARDLERRRAASH